MTDRLVAVTGGTGFLGRHCVAALAARGWRVRMLVRSDPTHPLLAGIPVELVLGGLDDPAALRRLVAGAAAVVHAAGATKAARPALFGAINAEGTARLAAAAAAIAPECRFVHISSQAARHPHVSPYAASKRAGEDAVMTRIGQSGWVILRPGIIYGPWDPATVALMRLAAAAVVPVPVRQEPRLMLVHVLDAALAVCAFCEPGPQGRIFELGGPGEGGHGWREVVRAARQEGTPRFIPVPDRLLLAAGAAVDPWSAATGHAVLFGRGKAREILHRDWRPDPALRPPEAVWVPRLSLDDGMRLTREWLASGGTSHISEVLNSS